MSSQKGNLSRSRPQKHKNSVAFKNTLHDRTPQTIKIVNKNIVNVCLRCKGILDWKVKYKKYKLLTKPANCTKCNQRTVLEAYHTICRPCASKLKVCPKCGKNESLVKDLEEKEKEELGENSTEDLTENVKKLSVKDKKKKKKSKTEDDFDSSDFGSSDFDSDFE
ncbi:unnamed protein product [Bemisia tabaci]|uniref:Uncharacterized protein n=1 Tax=Bemisia tabaci TaxID=7038 RepID=A0A9P0A4D1_BEMTA|nr:PREDICTED: uncharacterized protein C9orf85 homolog [Bemisia tabaci]CAH0383980.1 unnamed protein product [Bemisia tabaci]